MKTARRMTTVWCTVVGLVFWAWTLLPATAGASPAAVPGYIALGDSIDFGVGDIGGVGYVPPFGAFLESTFGTVVEVHNFSQPGAETRDIAMKQLPPAIAEVQHHSPFGVVISWGGGGNDLRHFISSPEAATCLQVPSCLARLNALLNEAEQTIDLTIKALRFFAGPDGTILTRTQYNALQKSGCDPFGQVDLANTALEGAPGTLLARGLNDRIRTVAERHEAKVVEIFLLFAADPNGLIADDCIHPNDAGYDIILNEFISTFLSNP